MKVSFSEDKNYLVFQYEDIKEYKALHKIPALTNMGVGKVCPAILPVAFNVVARFRKQFTNLSVQPELETWLKSPFKLLPLPEGFEFHTKPKDFQEIALRYLYTLGSAGILLDPGMGKSKVVLDYIFLKGFKKTFIVCPSALLFVWEDEIQKHRPELSFHIVKTTDWDKELPGINAAQVVIINYSKAVILKHRIKELDVDFLHLDEFLIKDPSTNRTKAITEIARGVPYRCGGSGTLINNSPLDMFCPVRYLQPALVGWNYSTFLDKYAVIVEAKPRNAGDKPRSTVVGFRGKDEVRSILDSCCIVMTKEKWLKLPDKHFHDIYVQMSQEQREAYYGLMRNYRMDIAGQEVTIDNPLVMLSKLYQISQGFLYITPESPSEISLDLLGMFSDETGALEKKTKGKAQDGTGKRAGPRQTVFFKEQPKVEALKKLLTSTLQNRKSIIWFNMEGELILIEQALREIGDTYLVIKGGDKKIGDKVREFNRTQGIKRLVCQAKSVNYGITVLGTRADALEAEGIQVLPDIDTQVADEVFFSLNFSLEVYLQQQDRIHRLGQDRSCNYYRIFANNPVETKIRQAIEDKVSLKQEMLIDIANGVLTELIDESIIQL